MTTGGTNRVRWNGDHPKELFGGRGRIFESAPGGDREEGRARDELKPEKDPLVGFLLTGFAVNRTATSADSLS
jgi:hypothetical protein